MTLMKNVNGVDVKVSPEEEVAIRAEWAANDKARVPSKVYDGAAFLLRITMKEYAAVRQLEATNDQVALWLDVFRLRGTIDVYGTTAQAAKTGLVALGAFSQARADELFS